MDERVVGVESRVAVLIAGYCLGIHEKSSFALGWVPSNEPAGARNLPLRGHLEGFDLSNLALKQVPVLPDPISIVVGDAEAADAAALTSRALHFEGAKRASILARSLEEVRH